MVSDTNCAFARMCELFYAEHMKHHYILFLNLLFITHLKILEQQRMKIQFSIINSSLGRGVHIAPLGAEVPAGLSVLYYSDDFVMLEIL